MTGRLPIEANRSPRRPAAQTTRPTAAQASCPPAAQAGSIGWQRKTAIAAWIVALVAVGWFRPAPDQIRGWVDSAGPWAVPIFVIGGVVMMSTSVPKTVLSLLAGASLGLPMGSLAMLITAVVAAGLNYEIGFRILRQRKPDNHSSSPPTPRRPTRREIVTRSIRDLAHQAGFGMHLLIRLSPIPTMLISYGCGIAAARRIPYLVASAAATGPQSLWILAGAAASAAPDGPSVPRGTSQATTPTGGEPSVDFPAQAAATTMDSAGSLDQFLVANRWLAASTAVVSAILVSLAIGREVRRRLDAIESRDAVGAAAPES